MLVAHDRWFLEAVGTAVLELEAGRSRFFAGPWHKWRQEKAARELMLGRAIDKQRAEIERLERFVERFRAKATKARQAQSRVKRLERIDRIERDPRDVTTLSFSFKAPERAGRVIFELEKGRVEVPGRTLLDGAELWLERGEHVALVGSNGSGKTTLIETLAGHRPLAGGKLRKGHNVQVGYLSQHSEHFDETGSVLDAAQRATRLTPNKARALLGQFLFSGEEAQKPIAGLSGGERQRLSLAILVHSGANVLILDEPTNHLDVESREALEEALRRLPRLGAARLPRSCAARRGRLAHGGGRGRHAAQLRGRLGRLPAHARGAQSAGGGGRRPQAPRRTRRSRRRRRRPNGAKPSAQRQRQARPLEERDPRGAAAGARDRSGGDGAADAGGGARRSRRRGRIPSAPPTRPSATPRRSARSRSCTRATSASPSSDPRHVVPAKRGFCDQAGHRRHHKRNTSARARGRTVAP